MVCRRRGLGEGGNFVVTRYDEEGTQLQMEGKQASTSVPQWSAEGGEGERRGGEGYIASRNDEEGTRRR